MKTSSPHLALRCLQCTRPVVWRMIALLLFVPSLSHAANDTLVFGVFPYVKATQIVRNFTPLRDLIAQTTGRDVKLTSAADYPSFYRNTQAGEYDIIFTAPHLGRLAEKESGYQRIAISAYQVSNAIVVLKDSPIQTLADLRGKTLAIPTHWAFVHQTTIKYLRTHGLIPGQDVTLREVSTNPDTVFALLHGDADAAASGNVNWREHPDNAKTRLIAETPPIQGFLIMAHPRVPAATVARLRKAFQEFNETPAGKAYFSTSRHIAFLPVTNANMKALDPYTQFNKD